MRQEKFDWIGWARDDRQNRGDDGDPKIFGTLGNFYAPSGYFQSITTQKSTNRWLERCGTELQSAHCMTARNRPEFDYGGYFEVRMGNYSILNIATVMYSVHHKPANTSGSDPFFQFAWLRRKLTEAARDKRKAWIAGHIPPGIETFGYTELWQPHFVREYLSIVQDEVMGRCCCRAAVWTCPQG